MDPGNFNSSLLAVIWVVQLLVFYNSALKEKQDHREMLKLIKAYYN
jgi:hypothetical protein